MYLGDTTKKVEGKKVFTIATESDQHCSALPD